MEEYRQEVEAKRRGHAEVVEATFELEAKDFTAVEAVFGKGVLKGNRVSLSKGYDNVLMVGVYVNEPAAVKHLVTDAKLPDDVATEANKSATLKGLIDFLSADGKRRNEQAAGEKKRAEGIEDAVQKAIAIRHAESLVESAAAKALKAKLAEIPLDKGLGLHIWTKILKAKCPKFLYFDEYYQMTGQVNIERLKQRTSQNTLEDSDRPMLGLIDLARLNLDQLLSPQQTEMLVSKLEGASNHLSKQILRYWSQNTHLHVRFDVRPAQPKDPDGMQSGTNLWGRVFDSVHEVSTQLGKRSRGFLWFFSFLAWFSQHKKGNEPLILLLDEPGLYLHGSAQGDLLRYIESELKPHHQVIYSTHSPFMVDAKHFERVRIVEDKSIDSEGPIPKEEQGTKVFTEVLHASRGSLFPLQGALGYDIAQTLFVGPNCLIVEGVSDLLYIQAISALLQAAGKEGLSPKWTVTPVGGSDKVPTFVALLGAQTGLKIATLVDFQSKDRDTIEGLYKKKLLSKENVLTFAEFTGTAEADIEDMFEPDFYIQLVNGEFSKSLSKKFTVADVTSKHPRILVRVEEYLAANPMKAGAKFNHYRPARYFTEKSGSLKGSISAATMERFESAFKRLNELIA